MKLFSHDIYDSRRIWKIVFIIISLALVTLFIHISNNLVSDLASQERERMEIWADATKELATMNSLDNAPTDSLGNPLPGYGMTQDVDFLLSIIQRNHNIPVLLVDNHGEILLHRNFKLPDPVDSLNPLNISPVNKAFLQKKLAKLKGTKNQIVIQIDKHNRQYLYYEDSTLLKRLAYYPYIQLAVLFIFVIIVYFALISIKKAEQNKVWVGLSKETAHQLGTPISSLMAWMEMLDASDVDKDIVSDMNKDVHRLSVIADRFSKIGSKPEMELAFINQAISDGLEYMRSRISSRVKLTLHLPDDDCGVMLCQPLFAWVMENLTKNAVDAMQGDGKIDVTVKHSTGKMIFIDVKDTGKGIARKNFKTVFNPGYTTKKRGWGLGLTLVKRIIEEYHGGHIYVKESELNQGTTFRIELPQVKAE
ncbi:MAG: HAMP domain-containing histidine kinase [Muribaculaceae bacterium]|jgi:two-component system, sporulation sensor kinase D|nr:HAMP domain-containing histidine kinase [Muribaculaceae bacterium]